jgi:hypothetical protein
MARMTLAAACAALALAMGCSHHVYSPPARMLGLESAATLRPGETGIQGELGAVSWIDGATGALRVRQGVNDDLEASVEADALHVGHESAANTNPNAYALRLGIKYRLAPWLSLGGGLGGGSSAAGWFVSPDLRAIVAWENPYVVPFLSAHGALSFPIDPRQVDVTGVGESTRSVGTPARTGLFGVTVGLRVPIGPNVAGKVHGSVLVGLGLTELKDAADHQGVLQGGLAGELVF